MDPQTSTETTFEKAVRAGRELSDQLQDRDQSRDSSPWTDLKSLKDWGWSRSEGTIHPQCIEWTDVIAKQYLDKAALEKYGTPSQVGLTHDSHVRINDVLYPATHARNCNWYTPGVIFAGDNRSPYFKRTGDESLNPLPELQHWSDLAFLVYKEQFPSTRLRAVVRTDVVNTITRRIVDAMRKKCSLPLKLSLPGKRFRPGDEFFDALLGTPNGKGVAYMLLQHGEKLGSHPFVAEIQLWYGDPQCPWLWFHINHTDE